MVWQCKVFTEVWFFHFFTPPPLGLKTRFFRDNSLVLSTQQHITGKPSVTSSWVVSPCVRTNCDNFQRSFTNVRSRNFQKTAVVTSHLLVGNFAARCGSPKDRDYEPDSGPDSYAWDSAANIKTRFVSKLNLAIRA